MEAVLEEDLLSGYPDGTFRLTSSITRKEVVCMIQRALARAGKEIAVTDEVERILTCFVDAGEVGSWARKSVAAAVQEDILQGRAPVGIIPQGKATRAKTAVMVGECLPPWESEWSFAQAPDPLIEVGENREMRGKRCPQCGGISFSASTMLPWLCPYCGADCSNEPDIEDWQSAALDCEDRQFAIPDCNDC